MSEKSPREYRRRLFFFALFACGLLVSAAMLSSYPHVYDDKGVLEDNTLVREHDYRALWTTGYWHGIPHLGDRETLYRPFFLSVASLLREQHWLLHLLVVASHFAIGILLFRAIKQLSDNESAALFGTAVFLFHPAQVETVAQAIGLMETMPLLLGLGAFALVTRHPWWAVLLSALAPGWKESGLLAGAVLIGYFGSYQIRAPSGEQRKTGTLTPLFLCAAVLLGWLAVRRAIFGDVFAFRAAPYSLLNPMVEMNTWDAFWTRLSLVGYHLRMFVLPYPLSSDYSRGSLPVPGYPLQVMVLLAIGTLAGAALVFRRHRHAITTEKKRAALFGLLFAATTVLPTLHLTGPIGILFAERFAYGLRGALAAVSALLFIWLSKKTRLSRHLPGIATTIIVVLTVGFFFRLTDWRSARTLFSHDLEHFPYNAKLHFNLGVAYGGESNWPEAHRHLERTLELAPDFPEAHYRIGLVYRQLGQEELAQQHWRIAASLGYDIPQR